MTELLLLAVFCSASLSLISYAWCWRDIRGGRPHIISLRQITGIMDRHRLNEQLGMPEPGYYYVLTPSQRADLMHRHRWFYRLECAADIACLFGVWLAMTGGMGEDTVPVFAALAGICQAINVLYSLWLIRKWHPQLREEIEKSDD